MHQNPQLEPLHRAPHRFGAELERGRRNALVGRVDVLQADEVVRHPHRQEAVALDPDETEEARVGDADLEERHRDPVRVELTQDSGEHLEQTEIRLGRPGVVPDELELDVAADDRLHLGDEVGRLEAGQQAAVQLDDDLARDDVDLLAAADDRRVDGVSEHRLRRRGPFADQPQRRIGEPRLQQRAHHGRLFARQLGGDPLDELAHDRRHVHRCPLPVEVAQELAEARNRFAAVDERAVTTRPADRRLQPADLLLDDLDRIEALPADQDARAAELAEPVADAGEELGMLFGEEARALVAAVFLVGEDDEYEVAGQRDVLPLRPQERVHEHRDAALHVERAAAPDVPVDEPALERRVRPALPARGDDVDVALEEQRRRVAALEPGDEVRPARHPLEGLRLAARLLEQAADELDALGLVAGRIRRVEADQRLRKLDDVHASSPSAASSRSTSAGVL